MNKIGHSRHRRPEVDYGTAAMEQMTEYCAAHPESPSAERRPQLFYRGDLWIALLGETMEEGIVGIGPTVAEALRAFDAQYMNGMREPNIGNVRAKKPAPRMPSHGLPIAENPGPDFL